MERLEQYEMETADVYVPAGKRVKTTDSVSPPPTLLPRSMSATNLQDSGQGGKKGVKHSRREGEMGRRERGREGE